MINEQNMTQKNKLILFIFWLLPLGSGAQDAVLNVLKDELDQQVAQFRNMPTSPYYINIRIEDKILYNMTSEFGELTQSQREESSQLMSHLRFGDYQIDSDLGEHAAPLSASIQPAKLPRDFRENEAALREAMRQDIKARYELKGLVYFETVVKGTWAEMKEEYDSAPNFTAASPSHYYEPPLLPNATQFDRNLWEEKIGQYSAALKDLEGVISSRAMMNYHIVRRYFVSTDGDVVAQNLTYCSLTVVASVQADDDTPLRLHRHYFAFTPDSLPNSEHIIREVTEMGATLTALRIAPIVDPYTGPALLTGNASAVFFHEFFGHRIEGQAMKSVAAARQTFKSLRGQSVLSECFSIYDDPTLRYFQGQPLSGHYLYDEQGMVGGRVNVVEKGRMKDFLMTRSAIDVQSGTNGHARAQMGFDPTSRQSNLIIQTSNHKTEAELRQLLLDEVRCQGKQYGFLFVQVTGGFTQTFTANANTFEIYPLEVYRVYLDGRPDELVRGVKFMGDPLEVFANIVYAGGDSEIFNGICGAASGSVFAAAISPMILIDKIEIQRLL